MFSVGSGEGALVTGFEVGEGAVVLLVGSGEGALVKI